MEGKGEDYRRIVEWYGTVLTGKKIIIENLKDLKSGNAFLETIEKFYPKNVSLTKIYIKPKNNF